jgi:small subunit ribosomal protein S2
MSVAGIKELFEAGVHFGHRTQRWNPRMKPYIFEERHGIYLINLEETHRQLQEACEFLEKVARRGEQVLFVGCKKPAQETIKELTGQVNCPYVADRWLGGTLTNLQTIRKSVKRLEFIENLNKSGEMEKYPKQEASVLRRELSKLLRNLLGIRNMEKTPGAVVIIDTVREQNAIAEAKRLGIPIVAIVDTNADPTSVDYPIAGNDDAIRSIKILVQALTDAIAKGQNESGKRVNNKGKETQAEASIEAVSA